MEIPKNDRILLDELDSVLVYVNRHTSRIELKLPTGFFGDDLLLWRKVHKVKLKEYKAMYNGKMDLHKKVSRL